MKRLLLHPLLILTLLCSWTIPAKLYAQASAITGSVTSEGQPVLFANVLLQGTPYGAATDTTGRFRIENVPGGEYKMMVSALGFEKLVVPLSITPGATRSFHLTLKPSELKLNEVVISANLKEVSRLESPVPVEVYTPRFFRANPVPTIYEALQHVNGVRPQINCSVCNTGDIHINGLEGPYTMVLIDGMPIVSGLSTVYGLNGIPQALIERVEIVKGPASTLYGSEAVGGLINVITRDPDKAPRFSADVFTTSWGELNADVSARMRAGKKATGLLGVSYFNYSFPADHNQDGFTDVTLQDRISVFNKWSFKRRQNRIFSLAARYVYEDRWGGEMNWTPADRGRETVYGESIYTSRWELFGRYQLPVSEDLQLSFSANSHDQNSVYGTTPFIADQKIAFSQLAWNHKFGRHDLLAGSAVRVTWYDDNTPVTASADGSVNNPFLTWLPGVFLQDEFAISDQHRVLGGMRYDHNSVHGHIVTPRINYKWNSKDKMHVVRVSAGNGYRVANVFTEDHAALTGSRDVVFRDDLKPETSWNANLNYVRKVLLKNNSFLGIDASVFHTYFTNRIIGDYDEDPLLVVYDNLDGHAVSQGVSVNADLVLQNGLKLLAGFTAMDVYLKSGGVKERPEFTEQYSGVWNVRYTLDKPQIEIAYTGNLYGPMRLPLQGPLDPRPAWSPWWSLQNIQLTKKWSERVSLYAGIKNLLNWAPHKSTPFLIARSHDPFNQQVAISAGGEILATPQNPYALSFDPTYVYAPNQGRRFFLGFRWEIGKR